MSSVTVALCTFNGARYLGAQLDSLVRQTRLPDEVVVRDDGSTDGTQEIISAWSSRVPFPVTVSHNSHRLGIPGNFWAALGDARGEIIALCDQDDVWHPERLERSTEVLDDDVTIGGTFTNGWCIDAAGCRSGPKLWDVAGFTTAERARFSAGHELSVLVDHPVVTGTTLTFRRELRESFFPWPMIPHDYWISVAIATQRRLVMIDEPLVQYRLHDANTIGFPHHHHSFFSYRLAKGRDPMRLAGELAMEAALLGGMIELCGRVGCTRVTSEQRRYAAGKLELIDFRRALPRQRLRRAPAVVGRAWRGDYSQFANGRSSWIYDLVRP